MIAEFNQCLTCKHITKGAGCGAFDVIPEEIATDQHDHRQPYPGDHGIRWEPKEPGIKHPMDE